MRILLLIAVSAALLLDAVASEGEVAVKRGTFPFMAFVYYPDQTGNSDSGLKFVRSAVLIRKNWLISAALENENTPIAFPEKTLIARLGAISIDVKMNFNEDEDEQEREIIQIARPYDFNSTEWWYSDISLLKTLLPFNTTSAVATFPTKASKLSMGENCFMLVYAKYNQNATEDRILMKLSVELISSSLDKCGSKFSNDSMVCAALSDEKSQIVADANFCLGNSGGPLICGSELIGTQTYIGSCDQPYLYQLLSSWDDLISCAMEEKCQEEQCAKICFTMNKDPPTSTTSKVSVSEEIKVKLADGYVNESTTIITPSATTVEETSVTTTEETITVTSTTIKEMQDTPDITTSTTVSHITTSSESKTEVTTTESIENTESETTDFPEEVERKANVEAKQHILRGAASKLTLNLFKYLMYGYFVVMRLA